MMQSGFILAQDRDFDFRSIAYILFLIVIPVLNWVVGKYKEWQEGGKQPGTVEADSDEEVVFEVSLDDDDEFVLRPTTDRAAKPSVPTARKPAAAPVPPVVIQQPRPTPSVVRPTPPVARPVPPVARPVQTRQPSQPQRKQKTRQQPPKQTNKKRRAEIPVEAPTPAVMNIAGVPVRSLRDAVILSEVLAPPLSIRQIEGRNSGFERPDI